MRRRSTGPTCQRPGCSRISLPVVHIWLSGLSSSASSDGRTWQRELLIHTKVDQSLGQFKGSLGSCMKSYSLLGIIFQSMPCKCYGSYSKPNGYTLVTHPSLLMICIMILDIQASLDRLSSHALCAQPC